VVKAIAQVEARGQGDTRMFAEVRNLRNEAKTSDDTKMFAKVAEALHVSLQR
jgi:hypothetical protein